YRLARNAAFDAGRELARRKERRLAAVEQEDLEGRIESGDAPEGSLVSGEGQREVMNAIAGLPALYREPFVLRHVSGWSYKAIADVMNMPVDSVETRLVRARRFLREALSNRLSNRTS
ncbi:MAG: RNA polymerase sigma factor, partial [Phycisphaerae bacterium]